MNVQCGHDTRGCQDVCPWPEKRPPHASAATEPSRPIVCHTCYMESGPKIAPIAAPIGDPARASMLSALMAGKALTASALAEVAEVSAPPASGCLNRVKDSALIEGYRQGRHRFYSLAGPLVGQLLETIMAVAREGPAQYRPRWSGPNQEHRVARGMLTSLCRFSTADNVRSDRSKTG